MEDNRLEDNLEAAVVEAKSEIQRRIDLRKSIAKNRNFVSEHFRPSSDFSNDFEQNFVPAFLEASNAASGGTVSPPNGTISNSQRLTVERTDIGVVERGMYFQNLPFTSM